MGIRDEIEKLSGLPVAGFKFPYGWINPRKWVKRKQVLSILDDKWECVGKGKCKVIDDYYPIVTLDDVLLGQILEDKIKPGDHIIILRRRKDE